MDSSDFVSISELADEERGVEDDWNYELMNYLQKLQTGSRRDLNHYYGLFYPFSIEMGDGSFWSWEFDDDITRHMKEVFYNKLDYGEFKFTHNEDLGEASKEGYQLVYQRQPVKKWEFKLCFNPLYIEVYEAARRTFVRGNGVEMSMRDFFMMLNDDDWFQYAGWRVHKEYEDGFIDDYFIENEIPAWVNISPITTYGRSFLSYIMSNGWVINPKLYAGGKEFNWTTEKDPVFISQRVDEIANSLDDNGIIPPGNEPIFANAFYDMMESYYDKDEIYNVNPLRIFLQSIGETGFDANGLFSPLEVFSWRNRSAEFMEELWKDIADEKASFMVFIRDFYTNEDDEYPVYGNQSISLDIIDYESRKMILNDFDDKYAFLPDFIGFRQYSRPQTFINYSLANAFRKV